MLSVRLDQLEPAWAAGRIVPLADPAGAAELAVALGAGAGVLDRLQQQWGPGVVVGSGGSSGRRRWCLQPLAHLQASADATALWLQQQQLDPSTCLHLNPLPPHHVSGLMPLVRARRWGCGHQAVPAALMRDPAALAAAVPLPGDRPALLSLVPTQLQRLMAVPGGLAWLRRLAVIWVGGAPLPPTLADRARAARLRLAPCYGATETAAMVSALPPSLFLQGVGGCGSPLADVELGIVPDSGAIAVRTARLSPGWLEQGVWCPLPVAALAGGAAGGWWRSGDAGVLEPGGLRVLGRLDGAIHSGGETVFPEVLEQRLLAAASASALPITALLLVPVTDALWGQSLVALVRTATAERQLDGALVASLMALSRTWRPAERPRRWLACPELAPTTHGKWQRGAWQRWLQSQEATPTTAGLQDHPRPD